MPDAFRHRIPSARRFDADLSRKVRDIERGIHTGWKWRQTRDAYLAANPLCFRCHRLAECVHHLVPRHVAPERMHDWTNLRSLCVECHDETHREMRKNDGC